MNHAGMHCHMHARWFLDLLWLQPVSIKTGLRRPPSSINPEQILKRQLLETKQRHVQDLEAQVNKVWKWDFTKFLVYYNLFAWNMDQIFEKNQTLKSAVIAERALTKKMEQKMNALFISSTQVNLNYTLLWTCNHFVISRVVWFHVLKLKLCAMFPLSYNLVTSLSMLHRWWNRVATHSRKIDTFIHCVFRGGWDLTFVGIRY